MPSDRLHINTNLTDKQAHFLVFAVGMCCLSYAQKSQKLVKNAILLVLYGVAVEFIQASLPISFHRGAQVLDAVADAIGVLIGYLLVLFLNKKINF